MVAEDTFTIKIMSRNQTIQRLSAPTLSIARAKAIAYIETYCPGGLVIIRDNQLKRVVSRIQAAPIEA